MGDAAMKVDKQIRCVIDKVETGMFDDILYDLEGSQLGIFSRVCLQNGTLKPMPTGFSQSESNLDVSITDQKRDESSTQVGWYGFRNAEYPSCEGEHTFCDEHCGSHCSQHAKSKQNISPVIAGHEFDYALARADCYSHQACNSHCGGHCEHSSNSNSGVDILADAAELHPEKISKKIADYSNYLKKLEPHSLGLFICHGHNKRYKFTELPSYCIAVIKDNRTYFQALNEVVGDPHFVPNIWRSVDNQRQPAGGFFL